MRKYFLLLITIASLTANAQVTNEVKANKVTISKTLELRKYPIDSIKNDTLNMSERSLLTAAAIKQFVLARLSGGGISMPTLQQVYNQGQFINNLPEDVQDTTKWWIVMDDQGKIMKMRKGNKVLNFASEMELIRVPGGDTLRLRNSPFSWGPNFVHGTDENGQFGAWTMDLQRVLNGGATITKLSTIDIVPPYSLTLKAQGSSLFLNQNFLSFAKLSGNTAMGFAINADAVQFSADRAGDALGTTYFEVRPDSMRFVLPTGIFNIDSLQNSNDTAWKNLMVYNRLKKRVEYLQSWPLGNSGASGTVSNSTGKRIAVYAGAGTTVSPLSLLSADRVMVTDVDGLPSHSPITATELNALDNITGNIQDQLSAKLASNGNGSALTNISKAQVGLSDVDNTSDAAKNAAAATLTNKNINGATNNLTNIPALNLSGKVPDANINSAALWHAKLGGTLDFNMAVSGELIGTNKLPQSLMSATSVTWLAIGGFNARMVASHNVTLAISGAQEGQYFRLKFVQDATGSRKLTGPDGNNILVNMAANDSTMVVFAFDFNGWSVFSSPKMEGEYTPTTVSNPSGFYANVSTSAGSLSYWERHGDYVTVHFEFTCNTTSMNTISAVALPLPVPSNLTSASDGHGFCTLNNGTSTTGQVGNISLDLTNDRINVAWQSTNMNNWDYRCNGSVTYKVK